jgi:hypothetical protein
MDLTGVGAGIVQTLARLWAEFDAAVYPAIPRLVQLNGWWLALSVPLWLVLGALTYLGDRRSRSARSATRTDGAGPAPAVTPFARPAMALAFAIAGLVGLYFPVGSLLPNGVGMWVFAGFALSIDVMCAALVLCLVAVVRDVFRRRRLAGEETARAYIAITIGTAAAAWTGVSLGYALVALFPSLQP